MPCLAGLTFTTSGFTDNGKCLPGIKAKADAIHGTDRAVLRFIDRSQTANIQERPVYRHPSFAFADD